MDQRREASHNDAGLDEHVRGDGGRVPRDQRRRRGHLRRHDRHEHRLHRAHKDRLYGGMDDASRQVQGKRRGRRARRPHQQPPADDRVPDLRRADVADPGDIADQRQEERNRAVHGERRAREDDERDLARRRPRQLRRRRRREVPHGAERPERHLQADLRVPPVQRGR